MLTINTIHEYYQLSPHHQSAILKALKTKIRLEDWLRALNNRKKNRLRHRIVIPRDPIVMVPRDGSDIHPSAVSKCLKRIVLDCSSVEMEVAEPLYDTSGKVIKDESGEVRTVLVRRLVPWADLVEEYIDPRLQMIFDTGIAWHKVMQAYGHRGAWGPRKGYSDEVRIDPDERDEEGDIINARAEMYWIKGAVDAVISPYLVDVLGIGKVAIRIIHEYKTINSNGYKNLNKPKSDHMWQATVYSWALDIPIVVYMYTNKDNQQMVDFPIPFDRNLWAKIEQKVQATQYYVGIGQMPPWEKTSAVLEPTECKDCGYLRICNPPQAQVKTLTARVRR